MTDAPIVLVIVSLIVLAFIQPKEKRRSKKTKDVIARYNSKST